MLVRNICNLLIRSVFRPVARTGGNGASDVGRPAGSQPRDAGRRHMRRFAITAGGFAAGRLVAPAAMALLLAACTALGPEAGGPGDVAGTGASPFGAVPPGKPSETVANAKIEALLGAGFGRSLARGDVEAAYQAQIQALEVSRSGTAVTWSNPATGSRGEVIPGPTYVVNTTECRDFTHTVETGGGRDVRSGTACRGSDGSWQAIA